MTFACLLMFGWRAVPMLFVCAIISTYWETHIYQQPATFERVIKTGCMFFLAHTGSYWLGTWMLKKVVLQSKQQSPPRMIILFLAAGSASALLAALLGVEALVFSGTITQADANTILLPWWVGDMAGVIVLAPAFMSLMVPWHQQWAPWIKQFKTTEASSSRLAFTLKLVVLVNVTLAMMMMAAWANRLEANFVIFFMMIPIMWLAISESPTRTTFAIAIFSLTTAVALRAFNLFEHAMVYEFAITTIAATAYFGLGIPSLAADNDWLRKISMTDALTGVMSRYHFTTQAEHELQRSLRYEEPTSFIIFDIDHFKQINDTHGHSMGDLVLRQVAQLTQETLRTADLLGRMGGDEFMVLLPATDLNQAIQTAERIRLAINETSFAPLEEPISSSFGVSEYRTGDSLSDLYQRADKALYASKKAGRNVVHQEIT